MDVATGSIAIAGMVLLTTLVFAVEAVIKERRRVVLGSAVGLALAALFLPFVAYFVAAATHHQATDMDLSPPTYIVVTAITCAALSLAGVICGMIAQARLHRRSEPSRPHPRPSADDGVDDVATWLPWRQRDESS